MPEQDIRDELVGTIDVGPGHGYWRRHSLELELPEGSEPSDIAGKVGRFRLSPKEMNDSSWNSQAQYAVG